MTPLQMLTFYNAVANNGKMVKPKFVKAIRYHGDVIKEFDTEVINPSVCSKSTIRKVRELLEGVVENGTAVNLRNSHYSIAGKTGTAQIKSLMDQELTVSEEYEDVRQNVRDRDHALFASYGPIPEPNLVVVVIVENGESGSAVAAPIAKKLIEEYQNEQKNEQTNPS